MFTNSNRITHNLRIHHGACTAPIFYNHMVINFDRDPSILRTYKPLWSSGSFPPNHSGEVPDGHYLRRPCLPTKKRLNSYVVRRLWDPERRSVVKFSPGAEVWYDVCDNASPRYSCFRSNIGESDIHRTSNIISFCHLEERVSC